jgi:cell division septation protein DedD
MLYFPHMSRSALPGDASSAMKVAIERSDDVDIMRNRIDEAMQKARNARALYAPKVTVDLKDSASRNLQGYTGYERKKSAMANVEINLFNGFQDQLQNEIEQVNVLKSKTELTAMQNNLRSELEQAYVEYNAVREKLPLLEDYAQLNIATVGFYKDQFKIGRRTPLDLLNSMNELYNSEKDLYATRVEEVRTFYKIAYLTGLLDEMLASTANAECQTIKDGPSVLYRKKLQEAASVIKRVEQEEKAAAEPAVVAVPARGPEQPPVPSDEMRKPTVQTPAAKETAAEKTVAVQTARDESRAPYERVSFTIVLGSYNTIEAAKTLVHRLDAEDEVMILSGRKHTVLYKFGNHDRVGEAYYRLPESIRKQPSCRIVKLDSVFNRVDRYELSMYNSCERNPATGTEGGWKVVMKSFEKEASAEAYRYYSTLCEHTGTQHSDDGRYIVSSPLFETREKAASHQAMLIENRYTTAKESTLVETDAAETGTVQPRIPAPTPMVVEKSESKRSGTLFTVEVKQESARVEPQSSTKTAATQEPETAERTTQTPVGSEMKISAKPPLNAENNNTNKPEKTEKGKTKAKTAQSPSVPKAVVSSSQPVRPAAVNKKVSAPSSSEVSTTASKDSTVVNPEKRKVQTEHPQSKSASQPVKTVYTIQLGTYNDFDNAKAIIHRLAMEEKSMILTYEDAGREKHVVLLGFDNHDSIGMFFHTLPEYLVKANRPIIRKFIKFVSSLDDYRISLYQQCSGQTEKVNAEGWRVVMNSFDRESSAQAYMHNMQHCHDGRIDAVSDGFEVSTVSFPTKKEAEDYRTLLLLHEHIGKESRVVRTSKQEK